MKDKKALPSISRADLEKMSRSAGVSLDGLEKRFDGKFNADEHDELFRLIRPLLEAEEGDENQQRSLEHEDKDKKNRDKESRLKGKARDLKETESLVDYEPDEERELDLITGKMIDSSRLRYKRHEELKQKIWAIIACINQFMNGLINKDQLLARVNAIIPLKTSPEMTKFLKQNGIDIKRQDTPQKQRDVQLMETRSSDRKAPLSFAGIPIWTGPEGRSIVDKTAAAPLVDKLAGEILMKEAKQEKVEQRNQQPPSPSLDVGHIHGLPSRTTGFSR